MDLAEIEVEFEYHMADIANALVLNEEAKFGRTIDEDGATRPLRDTGVRMKVPIEGFSYVAPPRQATKIPVLEIHTDDMTDLGPATIRKEKINAVNVFEIDYSKVESRAVGYVQENIAARQRQETKENSDAAKN